MKRQSHLIERIAEMDNLELAFHKAQKGKLAKASVQVFGFTKLQKCIDCPYFFPSPIGAKYR